MVFDAGTTGWSSGAVYFCTGDPDAIKPGLVETATIGNHVFYTD
jgi:hypothetical protein